MAKRFSRILGAAKYYGALDNYMKWIQGTAANRGDRIGTGEPRAASATVYIDPFDINLPVAAARIPQTLAQPTLANAALGGVAPYASRRDIAAPADPDNIVFWDGYRAARVIIKTGTLPRAVRKVSRVTGLPYGSTGGKSTSMPFGRNSATDTQTAAFAEIRTAILAGVTGSRVSLQPERS